MTEVKTDVATTGHTLWCGSADFMPRAPRPCNMLWIFFRYMSFILMCKLISKYLHELKLKTVGLQPSDFLLSGVTFKPRRSVWLQRLSPQKTESSLQPVGLSWFTERSGAAVRQSACQIQTWPWLFLLSAIQFCGVKLGNMWPNFFFCFCFTPLDIHTHTHTHTHPSLPPLSLFSLAWYLGQEGTAFSRQGPRAYCPLAPCM